MPCRKSAVALHRLYQKVLCRAVKAGPTHSWPSVEAGKTGVWLMAHTAERSRPVEANSPWLWRMTAGRWAKVSAGGSETSRCGQSAFPRFPRLFLGLGGPCTKQQHRQQEYSGSNRQQRHQSAVHLLSQAAPLHCCAAHILTLFSVIFSSVFSIQSAHKQIGPSRSITDRLLHEKACDSCDDMI